MTPFTQPLPCEIRLKWSDDLPIGEGVLSSPDMPGLYHILPIGAAERGETIFDDLPEIINALREAYGWPRAKVEIDREQMIARLSEVTP